MPLRFDSVIHVRSGGRSWRAFFLSATAALCTTAAQSAWSQEAQPSDTNPETLAGHSYHGETFNEGPRQAANLIDGMSDLSFPVSAKDDRVQKLFNQGIAALHGFWYLEAERYFRQAAAEQPELAIAYWGMALANANNVDRARGFIDEAVERRESANRKEQLLIDALTAFLKKPAEQEKPEAKEERLRRYFSDLEKVLDEFPDDIEVKALIAVEMWKANREGVPIVSYYAVDAMLDEVFAANPLHPAHHYRIHLWDGRKPENALHSAAMCGPSLPAIAHMWHMPGHIYSKLNRYSDAIWQQEASARVDHAHMIRARLLPDEIHNFAHNNEWLVRNLNYLGHVNAAITLSRNLVSLPRHPKYNTDKNQGSYKYGRMRLLQTLTQYELWQALLDESAGPYLAETGIKEWDQERLAWMTVAHHLLGQSKEARSLDRQLRKDRLALVEEQLQLETKLDTEELDDAGKKEVNDRLNEIARTIRQLDESIALGRAAEAVAAKKADAYEKEIAAAGNVESILKASWLFQVGKKKEAITELERLLKDAPQQVRPLALLTHALWEDGQSETAVARFNELRAVAGTADLDTPLLAKLSAVAAKAGIEGDWRTPQPPATDIGPRPDLASLGPVHWAPPTALEWTASNQEGTEVTSKEYAGKPHIVVFYLGFGCLHCVEQLTALGPKVDAFRELGIELVGISTESVEDLQKGMERYEGTVPFPLVADADHVAFKQYLCWDDFENQPLHGTFLIDASGRVRWRDIGYEPFTDVEFLLEESKRLLTLPE